MTIIPVTIKEIEQATPTIRLIKLDLNEQEFEYKAGQWIDCYAEIDGERKIVGYSLASSPTVEGRIELAVKISENHVSTYIHESAHVGDTMYIEGGQGDIYYEKGMGEKVVLIGAGIGVAPLIGMLRYIDDATDATATLIQSASTVRELVYYFKAKDIAERNPRIKYHPTVTQEKPKEKFSLGRIDGEMLERLKVDPESLFFLSGPGGMIPELEETLRSMGVPDERIRYEVWWIPEH